MRLFMAASLFALAAAAQELPQAVDLVQRIDQSYPWLNVVAFDVDAQGNTYLAGSALDAIPATVNIRFGPLGGRDIVVIKVDPAGQQIYGTAVGGSQDDGAGRIKVDSEGNLYLVGGTSSVDYPAISTPGSGGGTVVLKLDATGNILYNSRLEWPGAILTMAVDVEGAIYIGGIPGPRELPVSPGAYRASAEGSGGFIAKLDPSGRQVDAATYIEGRVPNLMLRGNGDVLFSMGQTIAALDGSLSQLVFSMTTDLATDITNIGRDGSDNVYAATPAGYRKYAPDGQRLIFKRDFAGASFLQFAVTPSGTVFLFGSAPPNYPTFHATQPCGPDLIEPISGVAAPPGLYGFLMAIGPDGDIRYATFMAEQIPRYLPMMVSSSDGLPYALTEAFLVLDGRGSRWQGIVRFDPDHLPSAHTAAGCLVHSATLLVSPVAPGTIMTLFGDQIGPQAGASFTLQDGHVPFDIAGASVTVDGKPAPVLYAQAGQINFIAPWSLRTDGTRVPVCVTMNAASSCLYAPTAPIAPGLFLVNSQIAAVNQDGTINSPQNPARSGSYVAVYWTGGGQLEGPVTDGGVAGFDLQRVMSALSVDVTISQCGFHVCTEYTQGVPVAFAGAVPTLVYGADVVIAQIPANTVKFALNLRATPQSALTTVSGYLYVQ
jgi:uncharacterized protein (TIGR03437 family)